jgi:hypothetical protein
MGPWPSTINAQRRAEDKHTFTKHGRIAAIDDNSAWLTHASTLHRHITSYALHRNLEAML